MTSLRRKMCLACLRPAGLPARLRLSVGSGAAKVKRKQVAQVVTGAQRPCHALVLTAMEARSTLITL